jgi:hypothetical protein
MSLSVFLNLEEKQWMSDDVQKKGTFDFEQQLSPPPLQWTAAENKKVRMSCDRKGKKGSHNLKSRGKINRER